MTNEEITVKYDTSIKDTDAADRTWSSRCCSRGLGGRKFPGWGTGSVSDPWPWERMGKGCLGQGLDHPRRDKMEMDPTGAGGTLGLLLGVPWGSSGSWGGPTGPWGSSGSWGLLGVPWAPLDPGVVLWVPWGSNGSLGTPLDPGGVLQVPRGSNGSGRAPMGLSRLLWISVGFYELLWISRAPALGKGLFLTEENYLKNSW